MNVTTQEDQTSCFVNAAQHLAPGGYFVIETMIPQLRRLAVGERHVVFEATPTHIGVDEYDTVSQGLISHHVFTHADRIERQSIPFRYVWPSEMDLMARIAGLELHARWADWNKSPFTAESESHISIWRKP